MADEAEDIKPQAEEEDTGPKIKMGRIGKKKKKQRPGVATSKDNDDGRPNQAGSLDVAARKAATFSSGQGFTEQDAEFMKKAIQVLCQSTNPLGKSIDFVTDDVDAMSKEFERWRKEQISCQQQFEEQKKITEEVVMPLQNKLADLEEQIKEQQHMIATVRSSVMRNEITIQNLLYSVIQSR